MEESVSIILPTYNECKNIEEMVRRINASVKNLAEIIVVDDNSPDGTAKIAEKLKNVRVIKRSAKGVGSAIYTGIKAAKGSIIGFMDADLSMPPELLPKMIAELNSYDVVNGSRYARGGRDNRSFIRVVTSRAINLFANIMLNFKVRDYDSSFVVARAYVFDRVSFNPKGHGEYCIELLYKCTKKGLRIKELGYVCNDRVQGVSKADASITKFIKTGLQYALRIIKIRIASM